MRVNWRLAGVLAIWLWAGGNSFAQGVPQMQWQQICGTEKAEYVVDVAQLTNGNYVLCGGSMGGANVNTFDGWVEGFDASGNPLWNHTFGGPNQDFFMSMQPTADGGFVVAGTRDTVGVRVQPSYPFYNVGSPGSGDYWVMRFDANGSNLWEKVFSASAAEELTSITQTSDGGFLVGGASRSGISGMKTMTNFGGSDYWVLRLDANGNVLWQNAYGGTNYYPIYSTSAGDFLTSVQETSDHGFVLGGYSCSTGGTGNKSAANNGYFNYWVVRTDTNGTKLWDKVFGGAALDLLECVRQTSDGGYILGGFSYSVPSGNKTATNFDLHTEFVNWPAGSTNLFKQSITADFWLVRLDASGNKLWDKSYGTTNEDWFTSLEQTIDGGFIMGGYTGYGSGPETWLMIKVDANGSVQWQKTFGQGPEEEIRRVLKTQDGGFLIAGFMSGQDALAKYGNYDGWLMKLSGEPPLLRLGLGGGGLNCSWPSWAPNFLLESNSDVSVSNGWAAVNLAATTNNGQSTISLPMDGTNLFFRLRQAGQ
jgi:hypothetical protein